MGASALIADPTRYTYMQVHIQIAIQRLLVGGKAMHYRSGQAITVIGQQFNQCLAGIALVQKNRISKLGSQRQLVFKCLDL